MSTRERKRIQQSRVKHSPMTYPGPSSVGASCSGQTGVGVATLGLETFCSWQQTVELVAIDAAVADFQIFRKQK